MMVIFVSFLISTSIVQFDVHFGSTAALRHGGPASGGVAVWSSAHPPRRRVSEGAERAALPVLEGLAGCRGERAAGGRRPRAQLRALKEGLLAK